jgi:hypothetical protein
LLAAAFADRSGKIETEAQRRFLEALVEHAELWDPKLGNPLKWFIEACNSNVSFNGKPKAAAYARRSNSRTRRTNGPADAFGLPLNESFPGRQADFDNAALNRQAGLPYDREACAARSCLNPS